MSPEESDKPAPLSRSEINVPFRLLDGPVHWTRVFFGVTVIILGVLWSSTILEWAMQASEGRLGLHSQLQAELVGWEVCAVAILFGAGLAGSCTFNGLKQGLCVGFGAGLVYMGLQFGNPRAVLDKTLLMMACIFFLSLAGGWFGSQLLPPVLAARRRSRILEG